MVSRINKETKIYDDYVDKNVRRTYVYASGLDALAYSDSEYTNVLTAPELKNIFHKGAVVVDDGVEYLPVSFAMNDIVGILTYVKTDAIVGTTAELATLMTLESVPIG